MSNDFKLIWKDGDVTSLAAVTYKEFETNIFDKGFSDIEYNKHLRKNNQQELQDFNFDSLDEAVLVYEVNNRIIKFKMIEDSDM